MKINIKQFFIACAALALHSCTAPKAIVTTDKLKENLPEKFELVSAKGNNSGLVAWKQFFTDSALVTLIDTALKNNQELMITLQQIEIARADVLASTGRLKPVVAAGGGMGVTKVPRYTSEGAGDASTQMKPGMEMPDPIGNFEGGLRADWELDIWHKLRTEKQATVAHYLSTVEGKNFLMTQLIGEVANSYYELLALDNQLNIVQKYIGLQQQALDIAKIQKQAAATTELAVKKFDAELAKSKAAEFDIRQQIVEKENTINALLGRYPQPIARNKTPFLQMVPQSVYAGVPSELLSNRPDVKAAELELQAAKLDVEAARKEFFPSFGISAALGIQAFNPAYLVKLPESIASNIVGDIAGPLVNKSAIQAKFNSANARQVQALYEYDKTILNAYLNVCNQMAKIKNMQSYFELKALQSNDLDQAIDIANQLFRNARADYLEVLLNQRDALDAKMELIEAKARQMNAVVDVYKNLGGGWR